MQKPSVAQIIEFDDIKSLTINLHIQHFMVIFSNENGSENIRLNYNPIFNDLTFCDD